MAPLRIALVHYHLRPGGVTTVLSRTLAALRDHAVQCVVLSGEACEDPATWPAPVRVVPGLGYDDGTSSRLTAEDLESWDTLTRLGYLEYQAELGKYCLGAGVLALGYAYLSGLSIRDAARPLLAHSFRRAQACFDAMESRCYDGGIRFLTREKPVRAPHALVCGALTAGMVLALVCGA